MPWQEVTRVSLREEFVPLATQRGSNRRELCRRFGISPQTGYKWLARYALEGATGLCDRSRRPRHSPTRTVDELSERVINVSPMSSHTRHLCPWSIQACGRSRRPRSRRFSSSQFIDRAPRKAH